MVLRMKVRRSKLPVYVVLHSGSTPLALDKQVSAPVIVHNRNNEPLAISKYLYWPLWHFRLGDGQGLP